MAQSYIPDDPEAAEEFVEQLLDTVARVSGTSDPRSPQSVARFAAQAIPHAHHCGLTLLRPNRSPITLASSDELPATVDALQHSLDEGPCLDAAIEPAALLCDDLRADARWPRFGPRCAATTGVRSMLSLRLPVGGEDFAAINFYSVEVGAFTKADVSVASVIVPLAALAVETYLREHDHENLTQALKSSRHISTAVGILMATHHLSSEDAFALLRQASMDLNRKLAAVADEVNLTGELPAKRERSLRDGGSPQG